MYPSNPKKSREKLTGKIFQSRPPQPPKLPPAPSDMAQLSLGFQTPWGWRYDWTPKNIPPINTFSGGLWRV